GIAVNKVDILLDVDHDGFHREISLSRHFASPVSFATCSPSAFRSSCAPFFGKVCASSHHSSVNDADSPGLSRSRGPIGSNSIRGPVGYHTDSVSPAASLYTRS